MPAGTDAMKQRKLTDAAKHMKDAANALKTGMLKWSKDWVSAASSYDSAALAFKQGGDIDNAREAYEQCSAAKLELGQYYAAAQALENSAKLA